MKKIISVLMLISITSTIQAQTISMDSLPYYEIPDYPENYSAGAVAARMVDGLGFRFYWATEGLRESDLKFRPNDEVRTTEQTIDHIHQMSFLIANTVLQTKELAQTDGTMDQKRAAVLNNLKAVSDRLRTSTDKDLEDYQARFGNGSSYPFWNMINGPIADCLWHCGQIVSFRRSSGNPFNSNVSVFNGKLRK